MKTRIAVLLFAALAAQGAVNKAVQRCDEGARLLDEIMATPEKSIPLDLLRKAECVALIPGVKKAGFVVGGRYGKGVMSCRTADRESWTGPSTVRIEGGSFGLQIGGSSTDIILLVMNERGREKLLASKFTLGADAAVAAGPVGRSAQAQTDAQMHAKILSYSRSRGVFAGVSLEGATLRQDKDANRNIYGRDVSAKEILAGNVEAPETARNLAAVLDRYSSGDFVPEPEAEPEPELEIAAQPKSAVIMVTSKPPLAEVELNQAFNGLTPRNKALSPGEYEVKVTKKGFEPWSKTVTLSPGESLDLHAELQEIPIEPEEEEEEESDSTRQAKRVPGSSNSGIKIVGLPESRP